MRITFAPASRARFTWDHWEWREGKDLAVFFYSIEAGPSRLLLDTEIFRSGVWQKTQVRAAYRGFFYTDPESGRIVRLVANTFDIPNDYAILQGNTVLDYGPVEISGKAFFLLSEATSYVSTKQYEALFRKKFTQYRKFETESKLLDLNAPAPDVSGKPSAETPPR